MILGDPKLILGDAKTILGQCLRILILKTETILTRRIGWDIYRGIFWVPVSGVRSRSCGWSWWPATRCSWCCPGSSDAVKRSSRAPAPRRRRRCCTARRSCRCPTTSCGCCGGDAKRSGGIPGGTFPMATLSVLPLRRHRAPISISVINL